MKKHILYLFLTLTTSSLTPNHYPQDFKWGVATSEFQNSGAQTLPNSNWAHFEKQTNWFCNTPIACNDQSGKSVDHWHRYKEDIQLMKTLGLNSFRFSIDWSAIEPEMGTINEDALKHYDDVCDALIEAGITPMATLHHFVHPQWFEEMGAFEKEENIKYFVNFCSKVFARFNEKIPLWCTINEPAVYAFTGYFLGLHSPGKNALTNGLTQVGLVLANLLKAHVSAYTTLKAMPGGNDAHIGIVHNILKFKPGYEWEPLEKSITSLITYITNDIVMQFLKTGTFDYYIPCYCHIHYKDETASHAFDFFGLNFYANPILGFNLDNFFGPTCFEHQIMGDMHLPIDPEGFAQAIADAASLGKPVYITETGMADEKDDRRPTCLKEYTRTINKAIKNGYDVRGMYVWTLIDNFEWHKGWQAKFGLFDKNRKKHASAEIYKNLILAHS